MDDFLIGPQSDEFAQLDYDSDEKISLSNDLASSTNWLR